MSTGAVIMLVVSIVIVWGGLIAGIVVLRRHPDSDEDDPDATGVPNEDGHPERRPRW